MIIIGEKINATRKTVSRAIRDRDESAVSALVSSQELAGADVIDLNAGTGKGGRDHTIQDMLWLMEIAQSTTTKPVAADSEDPEVIEAALAQVKGVTPWINSLSAEKARLEKILPLAKQYGCPVVCLCLDDSGIPKDTDARLRAAETIYEAAMKAEVSPENLFFDPLIMPLSTDMQAGNKAFEAIRIIKKNLAGSRTVVGLSNISFGLPSRSTVNASFLILAISAGLDAAIMDPTDNALMMAYRSANALLGNDEFCMEYISLFRSLEKNTRG